MPSWPDKLFDLIFFAAMNEKLDDLETLAEDEVWEYKNTTSEEFYKPILFNYLQYTYKRIEEENKLIISDDGQALTFNTGLVTPNQEPIFCLSTTNRNQNAKQNWHFSAWVRQGEVELTRFSQLPEMAHYFDDAAALVFDTRKELRTNIEHVVAENKERFPEPYKNMDDYAVQTFLKGAIDNSKERVKRNYKTAIPQYYKSRSNYSACGQAS